MSLVSKLFIISIVIGAVFMTCSPHAAFALEGDRFGIVYGDSAGLGTRDLRATAAVLINAALGMMGMVFFLMMLLGGFRWMLAGGNDEAAEVAKKTIGQAIVGVIIIFVAYAVTRFVFSTLEQAT